MISYHWDRSGCCVVTSSSLTLDLCLSLLTTGDLQDKNKKNDSEMADLKHGIAEFRNNGLA